MPDLSKVTAILPNIADYFVYGAIAVVTLIGLFKCLIPLWRTTSALRRAIVRLQQNAGKQLDKPVWQESRFVGKRLKGTWLRFLQNAEQLDRRGLPTNVEDYINDDTVTHGPGNAGLAELIPNLLTSLGILGTFMGLSRGLSSLNFADSTQLIQGIPDLLSGMRFAFGTSVAGISCSLVFNMLNRISQGSSYRAIDDFVSSFTQLAMSRPLDNDVQMIIQNQDRNFMLQGINETLVDRLADNVSRSISMAMNPVAESMDRFIVGTTRNQIEGVNHIVNRFLSEMDRSLGGQLSSLARTMSDLEQSQVRAYQATGENLSAAEGIIRNARSLQEVTSHTLDQFDSYMTRIDKVSDRDEHFEQNASELLREMRQESKDMSVLLSGLKEKMQGLSAPAQSPSDSKSLEEIQALMGILNDRVSSIADTLARLSEEA